MWSRLPNCLKLYRLKNPKITQNLYLISLNKTIDEKEQTNTPSQITFESGIKYELAERIIESGKKSIRNFLRTIISLSPILHFPGWYELKLF